jgi:hypothetical protein
MRFDPDLKRMYAALRAAGKPAKVALVALMRKLPETANALVKVTASGPQNPLDQDGYSPSFFCRVTKGFAWAGGMSHTSWPSLPISPPRACVKPQASIAALHGGRRRKKPGTLSRRSFLRSTARLVPSAPRT